MDMLMCSPKQTPLIGLHHAAFFKYGILRTKLENGQGTFPTFGVGIQSFAGIQLRDRI